MAKGLSAEVEEGGDSSALAVGGAPKGEVAGEEVIFSANGDVGDADDAGGTTKVIRPIGYIEIIRPRGREWKNYVSMFGWGGV